MKNTMTELKNSMESFNIVMVLMFKSPQNSYVEILMPNVMV